jgi:multidrug transporter EmrE-like cation transporter
LECNFKKEDLSFAAPVFVSLSNALLIVNGFVIFQEEFTLIKMDEIIFVMVGILVLLFSNSMTVT